MHGDENVDDVMMTVDVPFAMLVDVSKPPKPCEKTEDLKKILQSNLDSIKDTSGIQTEISRVLDRATLLNLTKGYQVIEKVIGDIGFCVILGKNGNSEVPILIRIKDGKAKVVGLTN
jgi:hypothetical protein